MTFLGALKKPKNIEETHTVVKRTCLCPLKPELRIQQDAGAVRRKQFTFNQINHTVIETTSILATSNTVGPICRSFSMKMKENHNFLPLKKYI